MGDPKKLKKKYSGPRHPWTASVLDEERIIKREYALGNKRELFKIDSFLKKYKDLAKKLIASTTEQSKKEEVQVLDKMQRLGLLPMGAKLDDVLGLELKDALERRLQSIVFRKGLARSMKQARQFITHRHIIINEKEITAPSYLVSLEEENHLGFKNKSSLADQDHPERVNPADLVKKEKELAEKSEKSTESAEKSENTKQDEKKVVEETAAEDNEEAEKPKAPVEETAEEKVEKPQEDNKE
tara:strand:- start:285 stop:1010 length:726 start_codon:yes stop_codon:yes gene_type:complete